MLTAWAGCSGPFPDRLQDIDWGDAQTNTVPAFRGRVPTNLVMISVDTLRKDHLDRYGDQGATPFLSVLAEQGVVLDNFVQCSNWTFASVSCTLAGRDNWQAGLAPLLTDDSVPWPPGTPFLARYLSEAGFWSVLSSTNAWFAPDRGNTSGYTTAFIARDGDAFEAYSEARLSLQVARLNGLAGRFFLHTHVIEPHIPYIPPPEYLVGIEDLPPLDVPIFTSKTHYAASASYPSLSPEEQEVLQQHLQFRYRAEVAHTDHQIARIFQDLETDDLLDDALVVIWSDHGEAFWERGFQSHAHTLHAEETDAVALLWSKNIVSGAIAQPVSSIDLAPTLLELYGLPPGETTGIPLSAATTDRTRLQWSVARAGSVQAAERDGYKLIFSWSGRVQLYDLNSDPGANNNLFDADDVHPMATSLWADLEPAVRAASALHPQQPVFWPPALL